MIRVSVNQSQKVSIQVGAAPSVRVSSGVVTNNPAGILPYRGDYEVTPSDRLQTLATKDRLMLSDTLVHPVPYRAVAMPQGGFEISIGG